MLFVFFAFSTLNSTVSGLIFRFLSYIVFIVFSFDESMYSSSFLNAPSSDVPLRWRYGCWLNFWDFGQYIFIFAFGTGPWIVAGSMLYWFFGVRWRAYFVSVSWRLGEISVRGAFCVLANGFSRISYFVILSAICAWYL